MPFEKRHHVFGEKLGILFFRTENVSYIQGLRRKRMTEEEELRRMRGRKSRRRSGEGEGESI